MNGSFHGIRRSLYLLAAPLKENTFGLASHPNINRNQRSHLFSGGSDGEERSRP